MLRRSPRLAAKNSAATAAVNQVEAVKKLRPTAPRRSPRRSPRLAAKADVNYCEEPVELTAFRKALYAEFIKLTSNADPAETRSIIIAIGRLIQTNADIYPWISYRVKQSIDSVATVIKQDLFDTGLVTDAVFAAALSYMAL